MQPMQKLQLITGGSLTLLFGTLVWTAPSFKADKEHNTVTETTHGALKTVDSIADFTSKKVYIHTHSTNPEGELTPVITRDTVDFGKVNPAFIKKCRAKLAP